MVRVVGNALIESKHSIKHESGSRSSVVRQEQERLQRAAPNVTNKMHSMSWYRGISLRYGKQKADWKSIIAHSTLQSE
jgi:hypothetical protein